MAQQQARKQKKIRLSTLEEYPPEEPTLVNIGNAEHSVSGLPEGYPSSPAEAQALILKAFSPMDDDVDKALNSSTRPLRKAKTIYQDRVVRIRALEGGSKVLFVSFTGIGHQLGGLQTDEFIGTIHDGGKNTALFVSDMQRLWYNHANLVPQALRTIWTIQDDLQPKKVVAIGNSMGGFGAILFSRMINADTVIAISPQFSVCDEIVPEEDRWREFRQRIKMYRYPDIAHAFGNKTQYFVFSGVIPEERRHMDRLPDARNIHKFYVPNQGHSLAAVFKENGIQKRIVSSCYTLPPMIADMRIRRLLKKTFGGKAS
ncbi:hypothetical protein ACFOOP_06645 [Marinicaulis aureus]|uniref:Uncharacterized protein n=1 Tax=Hyphococcus aureus TaxID=2666033 RepID=A0ABW1KRV2_9PROT